MPLLSTLDYMIEQAKAKRADAVEKLSKEAITISQMIPNGN